MLPTSAAIPPKRKENHSNDLQGGREGMSGITPVGLANDALTAGEVAPFFPMRAGHGDRFDKKILELSTLDLRP
jgi:hypothetical protein